ncbi:MAG: hypothetical protein ACYTFA_14960 [Planctomycetota bacterium]|jgi:hypothetical protein
MKAPRKRTGKRLARLSLANLDVDDALRGAMEVDPPKQGKAKKRKAKRPKKKRKKKA